MMFLEKLIIKNCIMGEQWDLYNTKVGIEIATENLNHIAIS